MCSVIWAVSMSSSMGRRDTHTLLLCPRLLGQFSTLSVCLSVCLSWFLDCWGLCVCGHAKVSRHTAHSLVRAIMAALYLSLPLVCLSGWVSQITTHLIIPLRALSSWLGGFRAWFAYSNDRLPACLPAWLLELATHDITTHHTAHHSRHCPLGGSGLDLFCSMDCWISIECVGHAKVSHLLSVH